MAVNPGENLPAAISVHVGDEPHVSSRMTMTGEPAEDSKDSGYLWLGLFLGVSMSFLSFFSLFCFPYMNTNKMARKKFVIGCAIGSASMFVAGAVLVALTVFAGW
jgi:hypothetical protein